MSHSHLKAITFGFALTALLIPSVTLAQDGGPSDKERRKQQLLRTSPLRGGEPGTIHEPAEIRFLQPQKPPRIQPDPPTAQ